MLTKQCFIDTYSVEEMNVRTLDENFKFSAGSTIQVPDVVWLLACMHESNVSFHSLKSVKEKQTSAAKL